MRAWLLIVFAAAVGFALAFALGCCRRPRITPERAYQNLVELKEPAFRDGGVSKDFGH